MKKDALSTTFSALADPTRRAILGRLTRGRGDGQRAGRAARDEPAVGVASSQGARASRASSSRGGRRSGAPADLDAAPLAEADAWMAPYRHFFEQRFARLEEQLANERKEEES